MKSIKQLFRWVLLLAALAGLYVGGTIAYAMFTDFQPAPTEEVKPLGDAAQSQAGDTLTLITWNIGFGAQGAASDFFYDGGKTVRMPQETVEGYWEGIAQTFSAWAGEVDVLLLQEVDRDSRRSYHQDQVAALADLLPGYRGAFAPNYDVKFIPIPFLDPMGKVYGGLCSWSRVQPQESVRHSFEGNYDWPTHLFFLDRCFLVQRFALDSSEAQLVVINTHNSAYDDGSLKARQMEQLAKVLEAEYAQGNYVIVGGDWNQFFPGFEGIAGFQTDTLPDRYFVPEDYPSSGWRWAYDPSVATNRSLSAPYDAATSRRGIIDYFLLSPNVELLSVTGIDQDFALSDHQPVRVQVRLRRDGAAR